MDTLSLSDIPYPAKEKITKDEYIKAEELDIIGAEIENIINKSEKKIDKLAQDIVKEYK